MKILISNNKTFDKSLDKILEKRKNKILSSSVSVSNIIKDVKNIKNIGNKVTDNKYNKFWSFKEKLVFILLDSIINKIKNGINIPICLLKNTKGKMIWSR